MIELLSHDGSDSSVCNVARVSFAGEDWLNLPEGYTEKERDKLIKYLAKHRHMTPFRHNSISIRCEMPIAIVRQLGKHQAGLSWNEVSRRYVKTEPTYFIPDDWRAIPDGSIKQGSAGTHARSDFWSDEFNSAVDFCHDVYMRMIADGVAPEMARFVLPQAMNTKWVWTGNLLAMAHTYNERIAGGAQQEVREFAKELDRVIRPLFPVAWAALTK